jgi:hypothetical protein
MSATLRQRVEALEKLVASLQQQQGPGPAGRAWLDDLYGKFAGDPDFETAMKLGRKYRKSLRPRVRKARPKR